MAFMYRMPPLRRDHCSPRVNGGEKEIVKYLRLAGCLFLSDYFDGFMALRLLTPANASKYAFNFFRYFR